MARCFSHSICMKEAMAWRNQYWIGAFQSILGLGWNEMRWYSYNIWVLFNNMSQMVKILLPGLRCYSHSIPSRPSNINNITSFLHSFHSICHSTLKRFKIILQLKQIKNHFIVSSGPSTHANCPPSPPMVSKSKSTSTSQHHACCGNWRLRTLFYSNTW